MNNISIICVDDQREVLAGLIRHLEPLETILNLHEAESARDAWTIMNHCDAKGEKVAVIISDHVMPDTNGVDLLQSIVDDGRFPYTRKLLLTGQATYEDTIRAINDAGIDAYIGKPWEEQHLLSTTRRLLTEFIFQAGIDPHPILNHLDQKIVLDRMRRS